MIYGINNIFSQLKKMKKIILFYLMLFVLIGCGDDSDEPDTPNCSTSLTTTVNGESFNADFLVAKLEYNEFFEAHELNISWSKGFDRFSIQLFVKLGEDECLEEERYTLSSLPSKVSLFHMSFGGVLDSAVLSNNSFHTGGDGYVEFTRCDADENRIDIEFGFSSFDPSGNPVVMSDTVVKNICFDRG